MLRARRSSVPVVLSFAPRTFISRKADDDIARDPSARRIARARGERAAVGSWLNPGEEVRLEARPHGIALVRPFVRTLVLAGGGGGLVLAGSSFGWVLGALGAAALALAAVLAVRDVVRWDRTEVVLTTEKLFVVHGFAGRRAAAVRLSRVEAVEVEQSLLGRLLDYGTLVAGNLVIPYVPEPRTFCRLIR